MKTKIARRIVDFVLGLGLAGLLLLSLWILKPELDSPFFAQVFVVLFGGGAVVGYFRRGTSSRLALGVGVVLIVPALPEFFGDGRSTAGIPVFVGVLCAVLALFGAWAGESVRNLRQKHETGV